MKIRNGFVSNSSSSSFVILLPENFTLDLSEFDFKDSYTNEEEVRQMFNKLLHENEVCPGYESGAFGVLEQVLNDYTIATFETGPDAGQIVLADQDKVKKILGE